MAHSGRLAIIVVSIILAGLAFLTVPGWMAFLAMIGVFLAGAVLAEAAFRRLARPEMIKADLEDRAHSG
jgi:hypothetical protein